MLKLKNHPIYLFNLLLIVINFTSCTTTTKVKHVKSDGDIKVCKSDPEYKYISEHFQKFRTSRCIVIDHDLFSSYKNAYLISKLSSIPIRPTDETKKKFDLEARRSNPDTIETVALDAVLFDEIIRSFNYVYNKDMIKNRKELNTNYNQTHNKPYQINYHWDDYISKEIKLKFQLYSNINEKIISEKKFIIPFEFKGYIAGDGPKIPKEEFYNWLTASMEQIENLDAK